MIPRVLLVDDEPEVIAAVQAALKGEAFEIVGATSADQALTLLANETFNVVVSDEEMPHMKGSEFLAQAQQRHPTLPRIMLSGRADIQALTKAVNDAEIFKFLAKPVRASDLAEVIKQALALQRFAKVHQEVWSAAQQQHAALNTLHAGGEQDLGALDNHRQVRYAGFRMPAQASGHRQAELLASYAERLSTREREIVEVMASGKRVKEIAQQFSISTHTVRNHLKAVYRKLNVRSQLELLSLITRGVDNRAAST
jgi:DNA-binding NarL/FixJ family response regulator